MSVKRTKSMIGLMVPKEVREWIETEAGRRRVSMSDLVYSLMTQGIAAETIDRSVARLEAVIERAGITREGLRQTLATRYLVEQMAKKEAPMPAIVGSDANQYADRELAKIWPSTTGTAIDR
jgi:hypothetical protein